MIKSRWKTPKIEREDSKRRNSTVYFDDISDPTKTPNDSKNMRLNSTKSLTPESEK